MRLGGGLLVLTVLLLRLGTGPFVEGLRATSTQTVVAATAVTAVTTLCCALRWHAVAAVLGAHLRVGTAFAAVYRAQFLNVALPGGVLGDVDRALGHGRHLGRLGPALRAVLWERTLGQVIQVVLTACLLVTLASPLRPSPIATVALTVLGAALLLLLGRASAVLTSDVRRILQARTQRRAVALTSIAATSGHLLVLVVAARAAGVTAPLHLLLPLAAVVLLGSALPLNIAGWGPREGVAAWAFGVAGLGPATGLAVSVAYGVIAAVATLPGALVLLAGRGTWSVSARETKLEEAAHG